MEELVLAIDPGREKCGMAVVTREGVVIKAVVPATKLVETIAKWFAKWEISAIVIGDGTGSGQHSEAVQNFLDQASHKVPLYKINEYKTTELARTRYWEEQPPRGWRRLLPVTMLVPPEPVDDYVAVLLAEKYFKKFYQKRRNNIPPVE